MRIGDLFLSVAKLQAANNIMANCLYSELKEMLHFQLDISENRSAIFFPKQAHKLLEILATDSIVTPANVHNEVHQFTRQPQEF